MGIYGEWVQWGRAKRMRYVGGVGKARFKTVRRKWSSEPEQMDAKRATEYRARLKGGPQVA